MPHHALDRDANDDTLRVRGRRTPIPLPIPGNGIFNRCGVRANLCHAFERCPSAAIDLAHRDARLTVARKDVGDFPAGFAGDNSCHSLDGVNCHPHRHNVRSTIGTQGSQSAQVVLAQELHVAVRLVQHHVRHGRKRTSGQCPNCPEVTTATRPSL